MWVVGLVLVLGFFANGVGAETGAGTDRRTGQDRERTEREGRDRERRPDGTRDGSERLGSRAMRTRTRLVSRVVDGDTLELGNGETVRLVGIDTPEVGACGFEQAAAHLGRLVLGKQVRLGVSDEDRDGYGRLLRYVDVGPRDAGLVLIEQRSRRRPVRLARRVRVPPARAPLHRGGRGCPGRHLPEAGQAPAARGKWRRRLCGRLLALRPAVPAGRGLRRPRRARPGDRPGSARPGRRPRRHGLRVAGPDRPGLTRRRGRRPSSSRCGWRWTTAAAAAGTSGSPASSGQHQEEDQGHQGRDRERAEATEAVAEQEEHAGPVPRRTGPRQVARVTVLTRCSLVGPFVRRRCGHGRAMGLPCKDRGFFVSRRPRCLRSR